jgi:signal peptidase I
VREITLSRDELGVLSAAILRRGNDLRFRARGDSMRPFIRDGDVLLVRPGLEIRLGDVVLCRFGDGRLLAHRVTMVHKQSHPRSILLQGDACLWPDGLVLLDNVLGRVVAVERGRQRVWSDKGLHRWLGRLWSGSSPLRRRIYRAWAILAQAKGRSRV